MRTIYLRKKKKKKVSCDYDYIVAVKQNDTKIKL